MPRTSEPLWVLAIAMLFAIPVLNYVYWPLVLRSGVLPPDADSIGIPMLGSVLLTIIVSPIVLMALWYCLRRYNSETRILSWRKDRLLRSLFATILFGGAATALAWSALTDLGGSLPWYEYIWTVYCAVGAYACLAMRAALVDQLSDNG